ncbi:MAG: hypothetical protein ACXW4B_05385 [Micavibrio sp.]
MKTNWLNWSGETLDQRFERVAGAAQQPTPLENNISSTLTGLYVQLTPSGEHPDTNFNPTLKLGAETVSFRSAAQDLNLLRRVTAISIEQDGVSHDFPIRFEKPSGLASLRTLFNPKEESPAIVVTGLDGNERHFQTYLTGSGHVYRDQLESTKPVVQFLTDELAEKYSREPGRTARPAASGPAF